MPENVRKKRVSDPEFCERLKSFRESLGLEMKSFARLLDTPYRTYQDYEHGISPPKIDFVQKLAQMGCDPTWLLTGPGLVPMSAQTQTQSQSSPSTATSMIERLAFRASAGNGFVALESTGEMVPVHTEVLQRLNLRAEYARYGEADGDSMIPTLHHGDPIIMDVSPDARGRIRDGAIYVFTIGEEAYVKRLRREPGTIIMMSDNREAFPERPIPAGEPFKIIGRVRWGEREL